MSEALLQAQQQALQALVRGAAGAEANAGGLLRVPEEPGLSVYRHAYGARLTAALRDNYTVLHRALGDEDFDALALAYLRAHPSGHASIRWFGDQLAAFMSGAYAERLPHPSLVDFARMDWALRGAFDAADQAPLSLQQLLQQPTEQWGGLVFGLHASVRLLPLDWAIEPVWRALRAYDPELGEPAPETEAPEPLEHWLLVWRDALETRWRALEPQEAGLLQALAAGADFDAICALAGRDLGAEAAAPAVVQALQRWLAEGLLSGLGRNPGARA